MPRIRKLGFCPAWHYGAAHAAALAEEVERAKAAARKALDMRPGQDDWEPPEKKRGRQRPPRVLAGRD